MTKAKMMGAAFAAFLSLAGVKKAEAHPVAGHNHDSPHAAQNEGRYQHLSAAAREIRQDVDVLFVDFDAFLMRDRNAENAHDMYVIDRAKLNKEIEGRFAQPELEVLLHNPQPGQDESITLDRSDFANELSASYMQLAGAHIESAIAVSYRYRLNDGRIAQACFASSTTQMTADELVAEFSNMEINAGDVPLEHLYDTLAKHELGHCMTPEILDSGRAAGEAIADVYALSNHVVQHGDKTDFPAFWRNLRAVGAVNRGETTDYNITPILDEALPRIYEAYRNGELQNLSPQQLLAKSTQMAFGDTPREQSRRLNAFHRQGQAFNRVLGEIYEKGNFRVGQAEYVPTEDFKSLSSRAKVVLDQYQQARESLRQNHIELGMDELTQRYHAQLAELVDSKPSDVAKVAALRLRQADLAERIDQMAQGFGEENPRFHHALHKPGENGLSMAQEQEALDRMEGELSRKVSPEIMQHEPVVASLEAHRTQQREDMGVER